MSNVFVGIGFGPIQSGLFLLEALASGNFERLVVIEVQPEIVDAVRRRGGRVWVNVAHHDSVSAHELSGLEIYNPRDSADVPHIVEAIACANEIATALPSIDFFTRGRPSPVELLARGLERKLSDRRLPRSIVYTAENHNHAAEALSNAVLAEIEANVRPQLDDRVAFLNTVIGKMSGIVNDSLQIERDGLSPFVVDANHAVLVEAFNQILINRVPWPDFQRGIGVFKEKLELLPFEEAKLYGHNAAHALLGYLAHRYSLTFMHEADSDLRRFVLHAFLEESGKAMCRRHSGVDQLFTPDGWEEYAHDLMRRMVSPFLQDRVERVIRDPRRKLAWNDRFVGTMRISMEHDIRPMHFAVGAAAAVEMMLICSPNESLETLLADIWNLEVGNQALSISLVKEIVEASRKPPF